MNFANSGLNIFFVKFNYLNISILKYRFRKVICKSTKNILNKKNQA